MPHTIEVRDAGYVTVLCLEDMMRLIDDRMGPEFRTALEEMNSWEREDEMEEEHMRELDEVREQYRGVIQGLREESEQLAELIRAPSLDRKKISAVAGKIGSITWRAL